eukprot:15167392-Alexandrium_andersonii.AAC.1
MDARNNPRVVEHEQQGGGDVTLLDALGGDNPLSGRARENPRISVVALEKASDPTWNTSSLAQGALVSEDGE